MERDIRYKPIALTQSAATVVSFGSAVLAAMSGWGIWALFVRQATSCAISLIGFAWSSKYRLTFVFDRRAAKWIWVFGWKIMINRIGEVLYESVDKLVVGSVFGTGKLGHYNNAYRLSLVGHQFGFGVLSSIAFSTFATIQNENSKLEFAFSKLCFWLARFAFFVGLLVWCCGESTVVLVYGEKWRLAGELFERMWIFVLALPLESGIRIFLIGSGHIEAALRMRSLQLGIFVPGVVGVAYFGDILTLPYIVNVSILFSLLLGMYYSAKIVQINWRYVMERPLMAMAATILLTWAGGGIAIPNEGNAFFQVASTGFLVSALFVALMILLNGKSIWAEWSLVREKVKFGEEGKAT